MKSFTRWSPALALLIALAGCASRPGTFALEADPETIGSLSGHWQGEYWGAESGRAGTIDFLVSGSRDSVVGDVRMSDAAGHQLVSVDPAAQHRAHVRTEQSLSIHFARVDGTNVHGSIEPYLAPDCHCSVSTTFVGTIRGDTISGTFVTRYPTGGSDQGRWQVTRLRGRR